MKPIHFEEETTTLAKTQTEYHPLPVSIEIVKIQECPSCKGSGDNEMATEKCEICLGEGNLGIWSNYACKYEFSELELLQINATKSMFISQSGWGFNPILPTVENRFKFCQVQYRKLFNGYDLFIPMSDGRVVELKNIEPKDVLNSIIEVALNLQPENIMFVEKTNLAIDETGIIEI